MQESAELRDVTALAVPRVGRVEKTGNPTLPYRLLDADGTEVAAVSEFLRDMLANDDSPTSLHSYAYELLAWFRFLRAVEVAWDRAGRAEARDFALWLKTVKKPPRPRRPDTPPPGSINPVTGKRYIGENYASRTRRHARAVVRSFYEYHRDMHGRPLLNPFPNAKACRRSRFSPGLTSRNSPPPWGVGDIRPCPRSAFRSAAVLGRRSVGVGPGPVARSVRWS